MSVFIKGMDMPECCDECSLHTFETHPAIGALEGYCLVLQDFVVGYKPPYCPLVEIETPHGRIVDIDAIKSYIEQEKEGGLTDGFIDIILKIIESNILYGTLFTEAEE